MYFKQLQFYKFKHLKLYSLTNLLTKSQIYNKLGHLEAVTCNNNYVNVNCV